MLDFFDQNTVVGNESVTSSSTNAFVHDVVYADFTLKTAFSEMSWWYVKAEMVLPHTMASSGRYRRIALWRQWGIILWHTGLFYRGGYGFVCFILVSISILLFRRAFLVWWSQNTEPTSDRRFLFPPGLIANILLEQERSWSLISLPAFCMLMLKHHYNYSSIIDIISHIKSRGSATVVVIGVVRQANKLLVEQLFNSLI